MQRVTELEGKGSETVIRDATDGKSRHKGGRVRNREHRKKERPV